MFQVFRGQHGNNQSPLYMSLEKEKATLHDNLSYFFPPWGGNFLF